MPAKWVDILDPETNEVLNTVDMNDPNVCHPTGIGEYCGGCTNCLIAQAAHSGCKFRDSPSDDVVPEKDV